LEFWKGKGSLAFRAAMEEAMNFMKKVGEARGKEAGLKALKANRNRLLDLVYYVEEY
jgi:hypothetical protein